MRSRTGSTRQMDNLAMGGLSFTTPLVTRLTSRLATMSLYAPSSMSCKTPDLYPCTVFPDKPFLDKKSRKLARFTSVGLRESHTLFTSQNSSQCFQAWLYPFLVLSAQELLHNA